MKHMMAVAKHLLVAGALLGTIVGVSACSSGPSSQSDADAGSATAAEAGTSLGHVGSSSGEQGTVQAPSALNASPGKARQAAQAEDALCSQLRADIRSEQSTERTAPSTSTDEDIVAASEAKADQKIAQLQQQYDQLGCSAEQLPPTHSRTPLLPPAPGGLPP